VREVVERATDAEPDEVDHHQDGVGAFAAAELLVRRRLRVGYPQDRLATMRH
jgi:hypothetical protein